MKLWFEFLWFFFEYTLMKTIKVIKFHRSFEPQKTQSSLEAQKAFKFEKLFLNLEKPFQAFNFKFKLQEALSSFQPQKTLSSAQSLFCFQYQIITNIKPHDNLLHYHFQLPLHICQKLPLKALRFIFKSNLNQINFCSHIIGNMREEEKHTLTTGRCRIESKCQEN
jgi:hypothetical protein